jgi:hypothetical protein
MFEVRPSYSNLTFCFLVAMCSDTPLHSVMLILIQQAMAY